MRHFIYKMTADNGGAPCVKGGLLSLAICKPKIRSAAKMGDWIYGFGGRDLGGLLIYIANVTGKVSKEYYQEKSYSHRPDCIYEWDGMRFFCKPTAKYHPGGIGMKKDIGSYPTYTNANVLLSHGEFRYLGSAGEPINDQKYPLICALLQNLRQGHRVNHSDVILQELGKLRNEIWIKYKKSVVGKPRQIDINKSCAESEGSVEIYQ